MEFITGLNRIQSNCAASEWGRARKWIRDENQICLNRIFRKVINQVLLKPVKDPNFGIPENLAVDSGFYRNQICIIYSSQIDDWASPVCRNESSFVNGSEIRISICKRICE